MRRQTSPAELVATFQLLAHALSLLDPPRLQKPSGPLDMLTSDPMLRACSRSVADELAPLAAWHLACLLARCHMRLAGVSAATNAQGDATPLPLAKAAPSSSVGTVGGLSSTLGVLNAIFRLICPSGATATTNNGANALLSLAPALPLVLATALSFSAAGDCHTEEQRTHLLVQCAALVDSCDLLALFTSREVDPQLLELVLREPLARHTLAAQLVHLAPSAADADFPGGFVAALLAFVRAMAAAGSDGGVALQTLNARCLAPLLRTA